MKDMSYSGRPISAYRDAATQVCSEDIASWLNLFESAVEECVAETLGRYDEMCDSGC